MPIGQSTAIVPLGRPGEVRLERIRRHHVCTSETIPGYRVREALGIVRGHAVRTADPDSNSSRVWTALYEDASEDAHQRMVDEAQKIGANGIVSVISDTTALSLGVVHTLTYGTAVYAEPD